MNVCNFTGRLVRDVEKRTMTNEKKTVYSFYTIAVQDNFNKDKVHFIPCQSFGATVDYLAKNGKKGMYIEFSGQVSTYQQKDDKGQMKTNTLFVSDNVKLIYANSPKQETETEKPTEKGEEKPADEEEEPLPF